MSRSLLIDALRSPVRPTVSVEFFPPKDAEGGARMLKVAATLRPLGIDFVNSALGPGARVAVEISLDSARELAGALSRAIAAADAQGRG